MQPAQAKQIIAAVNAYASDPTNAAYDVKKLQGRAGYRLQVGDWRVLFDQYGTVMDILTVAPWGGAY